MKCPKLKKWFEVEPRQFFEEPLDCLKEECSWYDREKKQCSEVSKRQALEAIAKALNSPLKLDGKVYTHPF